MSGLPDLDRRQLIGGGGALAAALSLPACVTPPAGATARQLPAFYADIERRTFHFFWDTSDRSNGLIPDRWPAPSFCSIAAVGFGLTAYPIGIERGWCSREEARDRTLKTLRFFWNLRQGPEASGAAGHKGFFYHFLDMQTGHRFRKTELSSVDSSILFMGMLFAAEYYDRDDPLEAEIRRLAHAIYSRADWNFFRSDGRGPISMGWHPETGLIPASWTGYNEGMIVSLLALGAPVHAAPDNLWGEWTKGYATDWRGEGATRHLAFAPLFGHQFSHAWVDFRGIYDAVMRSEGFDYFENSRRATWANRAYCIANPMGWDGYAEDVWGLTPCDGPGHYKRLFKGKQVQFHGYSARGPIGQPDGLDDGTIAPTAALSSLPFAPEIVLPAAETMMNLQGGRLYRQFGFIDSFNPSFTYMDAKVERGSVHPEMGWAAGDYIGIDQGSILLQAANHRSDFVWRLMRRSPPLRRGLLRAGFTGGWLGA